MVKRLGSVGSPILRDALKYVPGKIGPSLMAVVGTMIFTRLFVPRQYGVLVLINIIVGMYTVVISQLVGQPMGRFILDYSADGRMKLYNRVLSLMLEIIVLLTVVIGSIVMILWLFLPPVGNLSLALVIGAITGALFQVVESVLRPIFPVKRDFASYTLYHAVLSLLTVTVPLGLILFFGRNIIWMVWGGTVAMTIMIGPLLHMTGRHVNLGFVWHITTEEREILMRFVKYGLPMGIWFLGASLLESSDRYIIAIYYGTAQVAIYSSSYNIALQSFALLSGPLMTAIWPRILQKWADTREIEKVRVEMQHATTLYFAVGIGLIGGAIAVRNLVDRLFLGKSFYAGHVIIVPVMIGSVFWGAAIVGHKSMEIFERNDLLVKSVVFITIINIVLNLIFVPLYGWVAAAYSTLVSYVIYTTIIWWQARRFIPWDIPWKSLIICGTIAGTGDIIAGFFRNISIFVDINLLVVGMVFSLWYAGWYSAWKIDVVGRLRKRVG